MHGRFAYTLNTRATSDLQPGHCASRHFSKMIQAAFLFWKQPLPDGLFMQEIANSCAWNTRVLRSWKTHLIGSATCWTLLALPVAAQSFDKDWSVYGQAGRSPHSQRNTNDATLGVTGPLLEPWEWVGGKLSSHWDISVANWRAPAFVAGRSTYTLISAIPTLRYRADNGLSPWFADAGLGLVYLDHIYATPDRTFSTRLNFSEVLGVGRNFGAQSQYELTLLLQHSSNGGIKEPNPGENFVQLRFGVRF
jgi:lipid A 3-O-deacylase